jgi:hemoglobin-like flavoprotein
MESISQLTNDTDPSLDVVDPTTTLTKRQVAIIQKTWEEVLKLGPSTVGIALYDLYFTRNPTYQNFFRAFRGVPLDQLKTHPRLKAHGTIAIQNLTGAIQTLDDPETAVLILKKTGRDHARREIQVEQFVELHKTLMILLASSLESMWTPLVSETWEKALTVVMTVVKGGMDEEEAAQKAQKVV